MTQSPHPLAEYVAGWSPPDATDLDVLDTGRAELLADILDAPFSPESGLLPDLWHWAYFSSWPPYAGLNADGHPEHGPFQPPIPNRRRMWAGGTVQLYHPLALDQRVQRRASLQEVSAKSGRSGDLLLVTVKYDYWRDDVLCVIEEQNHVYRSGDTEQPSRAWGERPTQPLRSAAPWQHQIRTSPVTLFRMSALTANSHRIHYDRDYATTVEGYPSLVVHGPLLAMQIGLLHTRFAPDLRLAQLRYRVQAPVFVAEPVSAIGSPTTMGDEVTAHLSVQSHPDTTHLSATARYRSAQE